MSEDDLNAKIRAVVKEELAQALEGFERSLLAKLRPSEAPPTTDAAPATPALEASEEAATSATSDASAPSKLSSHNDALNPPAGDPVDDRASNPTRVSTRGGMHVYGPRVPAEHANFAAPGPRLGPQRADVRPGEHANFAPDVDVRGALAPAPIQMTEQGRTFSVVEGHANFAAPPHRWVGIGPDASPPVLRLVLPDGTQVTLPRGEAGPFQVGAYELHGIPEPPEGGE